MKNFLSAAAVAITCAAPAAADEIVVTMDGATYAPEQISASAGDSTGPSTMTGLITLYSSRRLGFPSTLAN